MMVHTEVIFLTLLCISYIPSSVWLAIFRNSVVVTIQTYSKTYSTIIVCFLLVLWADSIREIWKYNDASESIEETFGWASSDALVHSRLFRAQRNFYLVGAALFLFIISRRMVELILQQAESEGRPEQRQ